MTALDINSYPATIVSDVDEPDDELDVAIGVDIEKAAAAVSDLLTAFGVPIDDHTSNTHNRSAKAWASILGGYLEDPSEHLDVTFSAPRDPGLIIVAGISLRSMCAHHLLPFSGIATVAYRPSPRQRIVGLSKLARVVNGFARRLQVQEQIGYQTVNAIMEKLEPSGAQVIITAGHDCMRLRGCQEPHALTTTYAASGLLLPHEQAAVQSAHEQHVRDL